MNCNNPIIFRNLFGKSNDFVFRRITIRLVHKTERTAESTTFHCLANMGKLFFHLLLCEWSRIEAFHACPDRSLPDQRNQIHIEIPLCTFFKFCKAAGFNRFKEASADFIPVRSCFICTKRRKTAVSGDLRGNPLFDKRPEKLFGILPVIEKVVMGMGVNQARADLITGKIDDLICIFRDFLRDFDNPVIFNQNISLKRLPSGTIINQPVFK